MNKLYKAVLGFLVVVAGVFPGTTCFAFEDGDRTYINVIGGQLKFYF